MKSYILDVLDGDDGDKLLQFTDEFLQDNDWRVDDVIRFTIGETGEVTLRNLTKDKRDEDLSKQAT